METPRSFMSLTNKLLATRITQFLERNAAHNLEYMHDGIAFPMISSPVIPFIFWTRRGQPVVVRRATPADTGRIAAMLQQLSDRTRELRYLIRRQLTAEAAQQEAQRIAHGHTGDHVTLIVSAQQQHGDHVIAIAELVRDAQQPTVGEFAIVARDDHQGVGIGSMLLNHLAHIAPTIGITTLHAYVLPENHAMLALVRKLGRPYTTTFQHGDLEITVQLPMPDTHAA